LVELLRERAGAHFAIGTMWRFFRRRVITVKKRRAMRPSRSARM
jgi:hypothetical protein